MDGVRSRLPVGSGGWWSSPLEIAWGPQRPTGGPGWTGLEPPGSRQEAYRTTGSGRIWGEQGTEPARIAIVIAIS